MRKDNLYDEQSEKVRFGRPSPNPEIYYNQRLPKRLLIEKERLPHAERDRKGFEPTSSFFYYCYI